VLYQFTTFANGSTPTGSVIPDNSGNLYGMTNEGGANGWGTVYELSPGCTGSWCETVLHSFSAADGQFPQASNLIFDSAGNIYGTTPNGGANVSGLVFELSPGDCQDSGWCETVLYNFCSLANCADGYQPQSGVIWDSSGNLYGTVLDGVFELS